MYIKIKIIIYYIKNDQIWKGEKCIENTDKQHLKSP